MTHNLSPNLKPTNRSRPSLAEIPDGSKSAVWMAALPFILLLVGDMLPKLLMATGLITWDSAAMQVVNIILLALMISILLAGLFLAWQSKWPTWSVAWFPLIGIPLILFGSLLFNWVTQRQFTFAISQEVVMLFWIPLAAAVFLYVVARKDALRGLLACLPIIYILWFPNMEFVDDWIELLIKIPSTVLIVLAIAHLILVGNWRSGLLVVLGMNLGVGALFAYAGIYHGGTLPFSAGGRPNLVEVLVSLIPQFLATSAIVIGPLFARMFRQAGKLAGPQGKTAYHLALAGLLVVILANLAGMARALSGSSPLSSRSTSLDMANVLWLGMLLYLAGVIWLYVKQGKPASPEGWAARVLQLILPLGIPLAFASTFISFLWPVSGLYGIPLLWELPAAVTFTAGLVWLGLSAWIVTWTEMPPALSGAPAKTYSGLNTAQ